MKTCLLSCNVALPTPKSADPLWVMPCETSFLPLLNPSCREPKLRIAWRRGGGQVVFARYPWCLTAPQPFLAEGPKCESP